MTDRELLELAAKAAGYQWDAPCSKWWDGQRGIWFDWNPLTDDGEALRLAVKLGLQIIPRRTFTGEEPIAVAAARWADDLDKTETYYDGDPAAATRRAIVRAAAELGR